MFKITTGFYALAFLLVTTTWVEVRTLKHSYPLLNQAQQAITLNVSIDEISCAGQADARALIIANGGTAPYTYTLYERSFLLLEGPENQFTDLPPGNYEILVTDADGVQVMANFEILDPLPLTIHTETQPASCILSSNGMVEITVSGGTPGYEYQIERSGYQSSPVFTDLAVGNYEVQVRDANACIATVVLEITAEAGPDFDGDGIPNLCDEDTDADGVLNTDDRCDKTPLGAEVNAEGCTIEPLPDTPEVPIKFVNFLNPTRPGPVDLVLQNPYTGPAQITISGLDGKQLQQVHISAEEGHLSFELLGLPPGIYLLGIITAEGASRKKMVVE